MYSKPLKNPMRKGPVCKAEPAILRLCCQPVKQLWLCIADHYAWITACKYQPHHLHQALTCTPVLKLDDICSLGWQQWTSPKNVDKYLKTPNISKACVSMPTLGLVQDF